MPEELLTEIFGYLQRCYNLYRRSNAFLGILNPPQPDQVWNPVGLQLVNRRWRAVARPLYYREQVALRCTAEHGTLELIRTLKGDQSILFPPIMVLMVADRYSLDQIVLPDLVRGGSRRQIIASIPIGEDTLCASGLVAKLAVSSNCMISLRGRSVFGPSGHLPQRWERSEPATLASAGVDVPSKPRVLAIRLAQGRDIDWALATIFDHLWDARVADPNVPQVADATESLELRFEIPFALPLAASALVQTFLIPDARDIIWIHLYCRHVKLRKISYGVVSEEDKSTLQAAIDALGPLSVPFEIDVLDA